MNDKPTINPQGVSPLKRMCMTIGELPTSYLETMSYYEMLVWFTKFLQEKVIPALDNNAEALKELQGLFIELQTYVNNYFDNLDVQDEIDHKLDEMVEQGTLQEIIADYLNSKAVFGFDTVADMKSATNLIDGSYARTLGYYAINDGGGATYKVREITNQDVVDEGSIIALSNETLIAELNEKELYPEMFGAKGDGITNDTAAFNNCIAKTNTLNLYEKTYKINGISINKNFTINGNNATLIDNEEETHFIEMTSEYLSKNLTINNLTVDCPHCNIGIYINANNLHANFIKIKNSKEINIHIIKTGAYGYCMINNIHCQLSPIGIQLDATDCFISNYYGYNCMKHLVNNGGLNHINTFHGWNYNINSTDYITGSTLIETNASLIGLDIYIDTLENGIKLPNGHQYDSITLQNVSYFINTSSYPATQQAPTLLKNVENYTGYCKIDGLFVDENGWTDQDSHFPVLIDNINTARVSLTNVSNSGFTFGKYKPIETFADINTSSITYNIGTYVIFNTRKVKYKDYNIHAFLIGNMNTSCPNNTIIAQITFTGQNLQYLNNKTRVQAKFISSSNDGEVYDLPCEINNNHRLSIYNNTGISLGSSGNYGELHVYIDDIHQTN